MRCRKCDRYLGLLQRFCPKCGKEITAKQRRKALTAFSLWMLLLVGLVVFFYLMFTSEGTFADEGASHSKVFFIATTTAMVFFAAIMIVYGIIAFIVRLIIRQPVVGSVVLASILAFGGLGSYAYMTDVNEKAFTDSLSLIQDNLVELQAAKISGDSLIAKQPVVGASWEKVELQAAMVSGRLEYLSVPKSLASYHEAALSWGKAVTEAARENGSWAEVLPNNPVPFSLKLSDEQAEKLFQNAGNKIAELKEFGDVAIQTNDKGAMLYIAARLKVQRHWLKGVLYSGKRFSLFSSLTTRALADDYNFKDRAPIPDVDEGCAVDVAYYLEHKITQCLQGKQPVTGQKQPAPTPPQEPKNEDEKLQPIEMKNDGTIWSQNQNQNQNQNTADPNTADGVGDTSQKRDGEVYRVGSGTLAGTYDSSSRRNICIGRGGVSTGPAGNVYCLDDVLQSSTGIDASAIGIAKGNKDAKNGWDNGWHNLEGTGITLGTPDTVGRGPTLQAFYDACSAKGGIVGGTGGVKSCLPTTESGWTCEFKNTKGVPCWDFLTYSGGRYMGGNPGCTEQGLLPSVDVKQVETSKSGGQWDGFYPSPAGTIQCSGDFSYSIPLPAGGGSVRNNILDTTRGPLPITGGTAVYNMSISTETEGVVTHVSEIDSFRFYLQGNTVGFTASYDATITASKDGTTKVAVCHGAVSGVRQ